MSILTKSAILDAVHRGDIRIDPFDPGKLGPFLAKRGVGKCN